MTDVETFARFITAKNQAESMGLYVEIEHGQIGIYDGQAVHRARTFDEAIGFIWGYIYNAPKRHQGTKEGYITPPN